MKNIDTSGLICPEPLMLVQHHIKECISGDLIKIIATDPSTIRDIPKLCLFLDYKLLINKKTKSGKYLFVIKKLN